VSIHYHHNNIKPILYSYQKGNTGRQWAQSESPGCCQRHGRVLGPVQLAAQISPPSKSGCDPNPFRNKTRSTIRSYVTGRVSSSHLRTRFAGFSPVEYNSNRIPTPPSCRQNARLRRPKQQKDGGQPWNGGSGSVVSTIGSRHPRQRVLDPGYSMNLGWIKRKLSGDQNLTDRYAVGKQNPCDIFPQFIDSPPSASSPTSRLCHGEVGR